jgi:hypothetical protein
MEQQADGRNYFKISVLETTESILQVLTQISKLVIAFKCL